MGGYRVVTLTKLSTGSNRDSKLVGNITLNKQGWRGSGGRWEEGKGKWGQVEGWG